MIYVTLLDFVVLLPNCLPVLEQRRGDPLRRAIKLTLDNTALAREHEVVLSSNCSSRESKNLGGDA